MSDLGSKAALQADIDAKVTSNGNGENTGTRVRAALTNMVDTLSNAGNLSPAPFIYVTAGDNATGIYRYQFMNEGKRCYVLLGATATPENLFNCVVWADPGTGLKWNVTDEIGEVLFTSASDVATPDLATGWTLDQGTGPLPSIAGYPGPTVQDVLEQIAAKVGTSKVYVATVAWESGNQPVVAVLRNDLGAEVTWASASGGTTTPIATISGGFPYSRTFVSVLPFGYEGTMLFNQEPYPQGTGEVIVTLADSSGTTQSTWVDFAPVRVTITVY